MALAPDGCFNQLCAGTNTLECDPNNCLFTFIIALPGG
jgi:hypothetical protein